MFKDNGERALTGDVSYEGPLFTGKPESKGKIRVDVSLRGEEAKAKRIVVAPKYDDIPQFVLTVLTIDEIFSEKVRALLVRGKPRDLYDVWVLLESGVIPELKLINKKLALYHKKFDIEELRTRLWEAKEGWEKDLKSLLPNIVPFEEIEKALVEKFL